jgi:hypothetical protein
MMMAIAAALAFAAGCGGDSGGGEPIEQVPEAGGLRAKIAAAQEPKEADFPPAQGKTLQELANEIGGAGPEAALATSVFTTGENRLAFGMIDDQGQFVYGKSALYVAPSPDDEAVGPFVAPADVLMTDPPYRSKQAATEGDPFAAVYEAQVEFDKTGPWSVMAVTQQDGKLLAAPTQVEVTTKRADRIPDVGERAPEVQTDTVTSAKGDIASIDTREPPSDMHETSFADVVGTKPVALLFATPQLCQSRVCGPVTDIALQMKAEYGDRMEFIHQEVYVDNDPQKGLREPLRRFNLPTEPWLFVVGADGNITARLEGSFGLTAFEEAIKTAL